MRLPLSYITLLLLLLLLCCCSPSLQCSGLEQVPVQKPRRKEALDAGADVGPEEASVATTDVADPTTAVTVLPTKATVVAAAPAANLPAKPPAAAAAAAVKPSSQPSTPAVHQLAQNGGSLRNDRTAHISYSDDNLEETHCTRTGECSECDAEEKVRGRGEESKE
jgi:hypothetical protein